MLLCAEMMMKAFVMRYAVMTNCDAMLTTKATSHDKSLLLFYGCRRGTRTLRMGVDESCFCHSLAVLAASFLVQNCTVGYVTRSLSLVDERGLWENMPEDPKFENRSRLL
jgi:hypothetical protein